MIVNIEDQINRAARLGQCLEDLVINKVKDGVFAKHRTFWPNA